MKKGYKTVTMGNIADKLNISKNAVSIALSNKNGVSDELRELIVKTAYEMGYKQTNKNINEVNKDIIVLVPKYIANDKFFYYEIFWEIENVAAKSGIKATLIAVEESEEEALDIIDNINEDYYGVIAIGVFKREYAKKLTEEVKRIIFVDNYYYGIEADYILTANIEGTVELVRHLFEKGHRKIGFIGAIDVTSSLYDRWIGYNTGMRINQLEIDIEICITPSSKLESLLNEIDEIKPYLYDLKEKNKMPTAWITGNDRVAYSVINVLRELLYDVPNDISVVGFDDIEFSKLFNPPLTTARVPRTLLAREAVSVLLKKSGEECVKKRQYYTELIERKSTKSVKK